MCTSNYMTEGTESEANSGAKGKKNQSKSSLSSLKLTLPEQSLKQGVNTTGNASKDQQSS